MGCGASVDGDSDSQASLEEWERNQNSRGNGVRREPNRRRSEQSNLSEVESNSEIILDNHSRDPRDQDVYHKRNNGYRNDGNIAVVSDMVPYPPVDGLRSRGEEDSIDLERHLFVDAAFPPSETSLYHTKRKKDPKVIWMRPHELTAQPQLLVNGMSRHDIVQGILADCWFLSSCAAVAQRPDLMEKVIPPNQPLLGDGYKGMVIFQFWRFGRWVAVHVDDLLPTKKRKLIYSRSSDPKEFWVSLLEKAYAKVHGSYEALEGGQAMDALVDLTSGLAERYELETSPPHLYSFLLQACANDAFITCSRKGDWRTPFQADANGLVSGHAYTISAVATVKLSTGSDAHLVRIRNPWGNDTEWNGQWNDSDKAWRNIDVDTKQTMGYSKRGDGEFWMSFQDFCREFEEVTICSLKPDLTGTGLKPDGTQEGPHQATDMRSVVGRWEVDKSCGGSRNDLVMFATNPQFLLTVAEPSRYRHNTASERNCHVVVSVMQLRRRCIRHPGRKMIQIGFVLYKVDEPEKLTLQEFINNEEVGNSGPYINYREVFGRFELWPGYYIIVPATFEPNTPGSFLIRVYADTKAALREL